MTLVPNQFVDLTLSVGTQDRYFARRAVLNSLQAQLPRFTGTLLDIGCDTQPYRSILTSPPSRVTRYIGMDLASPVAEGYGGVKPDIGWDGITIPLDPQSVDIAIATELLEHCQDPLAVLTEARRVLRAGGLFFATVPFLWPIHDAPHDEYRYTPFALTRLLRSAGFSQIVVQPQGGWDASLAQMLGLWALRRPFPDWKRRIIMRVTLPIVRYLVAHDDIPDPMSAPMITGLWETAIRA